MSACLETPPVRPWTAFWDGFGALVVDSSAEDPDVLMDAIEARSGHRLAWLCAKLAGDDAGDVASRAHLLDRAQARGVKRGGWIYNQDPAADIASVEQAIKETPIECLQWDIEAPYKADEVGGDYGRSKVLVQLTENSPDIGHLPVAVNSYGAAKTSLDIQSWADARWPIFPQGYQDFRPPDANTYKAWYPIEQIHTLVFSWDDAKTYGGAIYRPEELL